MRRVFYKKVATHRRATREVLSEQMREGDIVIREKYAGGLSPLQAQAS